MSYGLPNEALSGYRRTESSTLMNFYYETHLNLQSNSDMYMWNQVNYNQSHYANVGMSAPYNHCSYPKVPCPHQLSPLPLAHSPLRFDDLPSLSNTDTEDDDEEE